MFTTIDVLTFLNFDDDSFTNRDLLIKLRDNVFFLFSEFMISTFAHEFLSREFVMLSFFAIRVNVESDSRDVFDFKSSTIFFFETIIFHFWESVFDLMNVVTTNLKISRIVCDFFIEYNRILMRRVKSIFFFSFIFTLQFDAHAMCFRFSYVSHFLCLSVMLKSQSLVRCSSTHVLHITIILQCLSICSYFWQLKHCRKMQFFMKRSHSFISKIFNNFSNKSWFVIFTITISMWRIEYFFFLVWLFAIKRLFWWSILSVNARCFFANTLWSSFDWSRRCAQFLLRWLERRRFEYESWSRRLFFKSFLIAFVKRF
jgi:hypothetical protein